ncbi:zf-CGNR multi-domain protein [Streptomyces antnestii]|uniref:Zf-CGNR multi-domain protein n=1 Tax=Streptomyces antnestii TaxID=2494256 RepID=A0A3S2Z021_9ACTN|nr:CGNR zinc finger domain-containing protein [Streptomyces sp. San01]RVU23925.1 zf-CGNR multi-domain protein [Streptomyces sp. San01]
MSRAPDADPRPLTAEPLAIDLLNTRWIDGTTRYDLLDSLDGLTVWLSSAPVVDALGSALDADQETLDHLLQARTALDAVIGNPAPTTPAADALNAVLEHGRLRRTLGPDGPHSAIEVDAPSWLPAWCAAENYLRLLADRPERIRPCANDACVLHFYDVSKNGTRRWCSMAGCGNRAKAQRHYARHGGA